MCLYCSEMLRYFKAKGEEKAKVAPNLHAIFEHFNRVSVLASGRERERREGEGEGERGKEGEGGR